MSAGAGGDRRSDSQGPGLRPREPTRRRWVYALAAGVAAAAVGLGLLGAAHLTAPYLLPLAAVMISAVLVGLAVFLAVGIAGIGQGLPDIRDRENSEGISQTNQERLQRAQRLAHVGDWELDVRTGVLSWSDEIFRIFELDPARFGASYEAFLGAIHPEDREAVHAAYQRSLETRTPYEITHRLLLPGDRVKFVQERCETVYGPDGTALRSAGTVQDVTAQKAAELALRESNEMLVRFVRDSPIYAFIKEVSPDRSVVLAASENYQEMVGIPGSRMIGKSMDQVFPPEFAAKITADDWSVVSAGKAVTLDEELNGRSYTTIKFPIFLESRTLLAGYTIDVTERERAQAAVRESEKEYRTLVENLHAGVVVHAPDSSIIFSNATASKLLGLSSEQMRGKVAIDPAWRFVRADGSRLPLHEYPISRVLATQRPEVDLTLGIDRPATGDRVWVLVNAYPDFRPPGCLRQVVVTFVDITGEKMADLEREGLQAKLALTQRLAAMGTLVSGIAHEINNPLAADLAGEGVALEEARALLRQFNDPAPLDREAGRRRLEASIEALEDATEGSQRVARIVKDLAMFANPNPTRTRVRLSDLVATAIRWVPTALAQGADIRVEDGNPPPVLASAGQMEQVIVNLVTNAAKATPPGRRGDIVIRTGPGSLGGAYVEVIDHGSGIAPEVRDRIFDPFFTTRRVGLGRGAGLGLAICHAIITDHGGTIAVESEVGKGSTFRVELPAAPAEA